MCLLHFNTFWHQIVDQARGRVFFTRNENDLYMNGLRFGNGWSTCGDCMRRMLPPSRSVLRLPFHNFSYSYSMLRASSSLLNYAHAYYSILLATFGLTTISNSVPMDVTFDRMSGVVSGFASGVSSVCLLGASLALPFSWLSAHFGSS